MLLFNYLRSTTLKQKSINSAVMSIIGSEFESNRMPIENFLVELNFNSVSVRIMRYEASAVKVIK